MTPTAPQTISALGSTSVFMISLTVPTGAPAMGVLVGAAVALSGDRSLRNDADARTAIINRRTQNTVRTTSSYAPERARPPEEFMNSSSGSTRLSANVSRHGFVSGDACRAASPTRDASPHLH